MVVYGEADRPRIVAEGFREDHPFAQALEKHAGTIRYLEEEEPIRWDSWDAVVAKGSPFGDIEHLPVLQVGGDPVGYWRPGTSGNRWSKDALTLMSRAGDELEIPDEMPDDLRELIKRELLPLIQKGNSRPAYPVRISPSGFQEEFPQQFVSLIHDLDGYSLAAWYAPPHGARECLYLPDRVTDLTPWLLYAFKRWASQQPGVFPSQPEWTTNPQWMTAAELDAAGALAEAKADAERVVAEVQETVTNAEIALHELREQGDSSDRMLLTGNDDDLKDALYQTFDLFGFVVTDMDQELREGQAKKEDLRVADGDWVALCEAKGYGKGAKATDINKLNGYAGLYAAEAHRMPDAQWYAVNQWRDTDPSSRPEVLQGADEQVVVFASQGGLVIDTRDLFLLRKAFVAGDMDAQAVREWLKSSTGRLKLPPDVESARRRRG